MANGMRKYGRSRKTGEYTECSATVRVPCPYHFDDSHTMMTTEQAKERNEAIAAKNGKANGPGRLSKRKKSSSALGSLKSFMSRRVPSSSRMSRMKRVAAVMLVTASLSTLAACGQYPSYSDESVDTGTSQSQSSEKHQFGTNQYDYDDAMSDLNDAGSKAKDKWEQFKQSDEYAQAKDKASELAGRAKDYVQSGKAGNDLSGVLDGLKDAYSSYGQSTSGSDQSTGDSSEWSMSSAPNYYQVIGKAQVDTSVPAGTAQYSGLDSLGRAGQVKATINYDMRKSSGENPTEDPSGWPADNPKTEIKLDNGRTYRGYMYNRSHLLAKSLGGKGTADNLVTGTRTQNVGDNQPAGGMAYTETLARDWLDDNRDGVVYYDVTPVYNGNEAIPRYNIVNIKSSDSSIDQQVKVWNTAYGYRINYGNGSFTRE